jgi:hypothetical protein
MLPAAYRDSAQGIQVAERLAAYYGLRRGALIRMLIRAEARRLGFLSDSSKEAQEEHDEQPRTAA